MDIWMFELLKKEAGCSRGNALLLLAGNVWLVSGQGWLPPTDQALA